MTNIKTIFILVLSLILLFAVSCDTESKTGVKNNPPENDTEITGGDGTETPPTPSEPDTPETIEIEAKDFPSDLLGTYRDDRVYPGYDDTKVEHEYGTKKIKIEGVWHRDDNPGRGASQNFSIKKWKKTTKGGETIKLEVEVDEERRKGIITFDCETKTIIGKVTWIKEGETISFNGKKIN